MSITPWSFSRIKAFEQCPKQFYHIKIAKDYVEEETHAMRYGTEAHLVAEEYIGSNKPIPNKFKFMKPVLDSLKKKKGKRHCEMKLGLDRKLEPCSFTSEHVWWRGIVDLVIVDGEKAWIVDYKTSKSALYADKGQLELMALATFRYFPNVKKINAGLLFVVSNNFIAETYTSDMIVKLWKKWFSNFKRMKTAYEQGIWNAHPSGLCKRHCVVVECIHNGSN
jgi:hypothetical protein